jgi:hypothetical protein
MRHRYRPPQLIQLVEHREGRVALRVDCVALRVPERTTDVPLAKRPTGPSRDHVLLGLSESRRELVMGKFPCELTGDRNSAR